MNGEKGISYSVQDWCLKCTHADKFSSFNGMPYCKKRHTHYRTNPFCESYEEAPQ